jgi:hypothetical protein
MQTQVVRLRRILQQAKNSEIIEKTNEAERTTTNSQGETKTEPQLTT